MSRYRGAKVKIIKRLGELPGFTKKTEININKVGKINRKPTDYRLRLEEKQKLKFNYGLTENQLYNYVKIARRQQGVTGLLLLQLLEMRLDTICFSFGLAPTIGSARQLVNHGHILVNEKKVDIPSFQCKKKDIISLKNENSKRLVKNFLDIKNIPSHLIFDKNNLKGEIKDFCCREDILLSLNELLVVEFYTRR